MKTRNDEPINFENLSIDFLPVNTGIPFSLKWNNYNIVVSRYQGQTMIVGKERMVVQQETIKLHMFSNDCEILKSFVNQAVQHMHEKQRQGINIFVMREHCGWKRIHVKSPRLLSTVHLDANIASDLKTDMQTFLSSSDWYKSKGIPYKRGYLFYGPPGCGKSSLCQALAVELKMDMYIMNMKAGNLSEIRFATQLNDTLPKSIVLIEDVDTLFTNRNDKEDSTRNVYNPISLSGMLNCLDGIASEENRIFMLTTNYVEALDSALVRPGRCDVKTLIDYASRTQIHKMFLHFYSEQLESAPSQVRAHADAFAHAIPPYTMSMAQIQEHLIRHRHSPHDAMRTVGELIHKK
jgi:chaperone BCS1